MTRSRLRLALVVVLSFGGLGPGCGPAPIVRPYAYVRNGGEGPHAAACDEPALRIAHDGARVLAAPADGCDTEAAPLGVEVSAAFAYARVRTAREAAGPIVSNAVELWLLPLLASGADQRGLASGAEQRGLASGAEQRGLASGAEQRGLASGADQRGLAAGADQRGLASGADQRGLAVGADARVPWTLRKTVSSERVHEGEEVAFGLRFTNDGAQPVEHLVVVDRVAPLLRVIDPGGARPYVLADQSTLLVWDLHEVIPSGRSRAVGFRAVARRREELDGSTAP